MFLFLWLPLPCPQESSKGSVLFLCFNKGNETKRLVEISGTVYKLCVSIRGGSCPCGRAAGNLLCSAWIGG